MVYGKHFDSSLLRMGESMMTETHKLFVVSDFDHTLTTMTSKQCHDVVVLNKEYSKDIHDKFNEICALSYEDMKSGGNLEHWWKQTNNLLVDQSGLTQDMFLRGMKTSEEHIRLRDEIPALMTCCRDASIPFVITSAGITNVISETLTSHGISTHHDEHFHIDANVLEFHADGRLHRIMPESPIHSNSKRFVHHRVSHVFQRTSASSIDSSCTPSSSSSTSMMCTVVEVEEEQAVSDQDKDGEYDGAASSSIAAIILGDREGDFEVFKDGVKDASLFRVGFAGDEARANVLIASDCCDVVLVGTEQGVAPVLDLVRALVELRDSSRIERSKGRANKWDTYHEKGETNRPPWESDDPFQGLVDYFQQQKQQQLQVQQEVNDEKNEVPGMNLIVVELGSGSSATAVWLAGHGCRVTAVDISAPGLERAQSLTNAHKVRWMQADLLSQGLFTTDHPVYPRSPSVSSSSADTTGGLIASDGGNERLAKGEFDMVFDMQCYHVLREASRGDEKQAARVIADLLKPGGVAMIVAGALTTPTTTTTPTSTTATVTHVVVPGPPKLTKNELIDPLLATGLLLESISLQRFSPTEYYTANMPNGEAPEAWVAIFRKPL